MSCANGSEHEIIRADTRYKKAKQKRARADTLMRVGGRAAGETKWIELGGPAQSNLYCLRARGGEMQSTPFKWEPAGAGGQLHPVAASKQTRAVSLSPGARRNCPHPAGRPPLMVGGRTRAEFYSNRHPDRLIACAPSCLPKSTAWAPQAAPPNQNH